MKIGREEIQKAYDIYVKYKQGKENLDARIVENEEWYKMHHWKDRRASGVRQTGWLFAAINNKHADFMDNKPEVNILPREQSDQETATALTEIMPVILKRAGFETAYDEASYTKTKFGAATYSVLWDPTMDNGLGNVKIGLVPTLNFYWEPGIEDLQESKNIFYTELIDHDVLKETYPDNKDVQERLSAPADLAVRYVQDENIDTSEKSLVINWYYKKEGKLHYCRFVQDIVLFASENEKGFENGWYSDGSYPFVMDSLFPEHDSPHGFGLIDAMRDTQEDIDQLNAATMKNAKIAARRRWFVRDSAQINEAEFSDFDKDFVHVGGSLDELSLREIDNNLLGGVYVGILENKVAELKENSANRDVNSGGTGGTQTAAGIASLQESGSKVSRAMIQATYRAFEQIVNLVIERLRQFYDVPRIFRIVGDDKQVRYESFSNAGLVGQPIGGIGMDFGEKEPVFDLDVRVSKSNAWSRQAQNQDILNFYAQGFFMPQNSTQALACLEVLQIDNKDKLIETIKKNGLKEQFAARFLPLLIQAAMMVDPQTGAAAQQAAVEAGLMEAPQPSMQQAGPGQMAKTDVNGQMQRANSYMDKQRAIAAARTAPGA